MRYRTFRGGASRQCSRKKFITVFLVIIVVIIVVKTWRRLERPSQVVNNDDRYKQWISEYLNNISADLGHLGKPVHLTGQEKANGIQIHWKKAINLVVSNKIPLQRQLKDVRHSLCLKENYNATQLPTASVVVIFYNEAWSVLLRTVHSVLQETPRQYLKEIILVDDASDEEELGGTLDYYVRTRLPKLVRLIRSPERRGLIKTRLAGARNATGDVLVFLDAHCEVTKGWLPPLLKRIKENPHVVLVPIIDVIDDKTLEYKPAGGSINFQIGGFHWSGNFDWMAMPERLIKTRTSAVSPVATPTMAGGLFAIERRYFWQSGSYDDKMEGWGGENLEMSFRIWQCGGSIEIVPCSRVGHIFRNFFPYDFPGNRDTDLVNTARAVNVWMDDYKRLVYLNHPQLRKYANDVGDIDKRVSLRNRLKCRSFKWYLDNVYPEKFVPDENVIVHGTVRLRSADLCLANVNYIDYTSYPLGVIRCFEDLHPSQYFSLTESGELRQEDMCATVFKNSTNVQMYYCSAVKNVKWNYVEGGKIKHEDSGLCLEATDKQQVVVSRCARSTGQSWEFDHSGNDIPPR